MHVLFGATITAQIGPLQPLLPDFATLRLLPTGLAVLAGVLLLRLHWPLPWVLVICGAVSALSLAF